jgi:hypothetical protein
MNKVLPEPVELTKTYNIVSFNYLVIEFTLFTSANILLSFLDENNISQKQTEYLIIGDEYDAWGGDDEYILDLIISKIPDLLK